MRFNFLLVSTLLLSAACQNETRHELAQMKLGSGKPASLDIFGRVVLGERNQHIHFETGIVPIPFVQTQAGIVNLDRLRNRSFSEHNGRGSAGYIKARSLNISEQHLSAQRFDDISLTELKRSRRLRTSIAQFPLREDFGNKGFTRAIFAEQNTHDKTTVFYALDSSEAAVFGRILGRPLQFPVLVDSNYLIENFK